MAGTNNSWNNQIAGSYNQIILNAGTNGVAISTDASAATVNVATGGAVKTVTLGSTNSTSATTVQSGSGVLNVTATGGALTINSGTGALSISNDASATTVSIATGGAAKLTTLGSTSGASSLALKYGTADFTLASATGTVMSALDTGEITYPLQPAFSAYLASSDNNATGDGTTYTLGAVTALTEIFDQNADFNTNGTFMAPVTGRYFFGMNWLLTALAAANNVSFSLNTSNRNYVHANDASAFVGNNLYSWSQFADMDSGDTATTTTTVGAGAKIVNVFGDVNYRTTFFGYLVC